MDYEWLWSFVIHKASNQTSVHQFISQVLQFEDDQSLEALAQEMVQRLSNCDPPEVGPLELFVGWLNQSEQRFLGKQHPKIWELNW